ncbi:6-carboxytetrahydropterin synthase [Marinibactrum halimedae]|uniref:6-carboxy-5,6,7,8-tetrahydropterin synthase n=1 Tax=Marinibactrum halimedae TaxID=1444977 RepID=A0AA37WLT0_9GAMM|nr:6-carboxytetrahydropterin synthase [Marinibactrum halimedae]MCD9457865.1 6-carboxytetrahydropterin synthase [Marinibactrum halimedae]GLS26314.1 hypothetical protein GCM10007877_20290 [Marinibactrum halimedae]
MYLFVDELTNVDFSYLDPIRGIVGETWLANFGLEGSLNEQGMICDFGIVKKLFRDWLDNEIDHRLVVPTQSDYINIDHHNDQTTITWMLKGKNSDHTLGSKIIISGPHCAFALIDAAIINADTVAAHVINQVSTLMPHSVKRVDLTFSTENISGEYYHYSHGLKKHDGNCQRIAHGHRSTIEIRVNEQRNTQLEKQWSERWRDIYLGTEEDIVDSTTEGETEYWHFEYQAQQGEFKLIIPKNHCEIIPTDTTVEWLCHYIASTLKAEIDSNQTITVKAFEGIGKGAIVAL